MTKKQKDEALECINRKISDYKSSIEDILNNQTLDETAKRVLINEANEKIKELENEKKNVE